MALIKIALLLLVCLESCALTSDFNIVGLQNIPDDLQATQNGDVCKDCTQIFELLVDLVSNGDFQKMLMNGVENVCRLLPVAPAKLCKEEVEKMLPLAVKFITAVKPEVVCKVMGLCPSCNRQEKMLWNFIKEAFQVAMAGENVGPIKSCSFCIFLVKTLEGLLLNKRTESAVIDLLEEICHILPPSYRDQCDVVIGKFGKMVLDALLSYATPQAICSLIQLCKGQEAPAADPCTLTRYRCSDIKTAIKCGTVLYCQKFAWKPLNYKH